jgi:hypothetical protein
MLYCLGSKNNNYIEITHREYIERGMSIYLHTWSAIGHFTKEAHHQNCTNKSLVIHNAPNRYNHHKFL